MISNLIILRIHTGNHRVLDLYFQKNWLVKLLIIKIDRVFN